MSELQKLLEGLETDQTNEDPFAHLQTSKQEATATDTTEAEQHEGGDNLKPHNRRERRLEARLQAERESSIQLAAKLAAIEEMRADSNRTQETDDYLSAVERIYGTETPEGREATDILKQVLKQAKEDAKREALEAVEERSAQQNKAISEAEGLLDQMVEELEDEFDIDLTSAKAEKHRVGFFKELQRMSPKDRDGNILYYADHFAVWEDYQNKTKPTVDTTARDLAARSMTTGGGASPKTDLTTDTTERYLLEKGYI